MVKTIDRVVVPEKGMIPSPFGLTVEIPAYRHINSGTEQGGWVAVTAEVDRSVHVGPDVTVLGHAKITGNVKLLGHVRVWGNATISGNVMLGDNVWVYDNAVLKSSVDKSIQMWGQCSAFENTVITGGLRAQGGCTFTGRAQVSNLDVSGELRFDGKGEVNYLWPGA